MIKKNFFQLPISNSSFYLHFLLHFLACNVGIYVIHLKKIYIYISVFILMFFLFIDLLENYISFKDIKISIVPISEL